MNESVLYTLAQVGVTLAGFSGLVVAFRVRGAHKWTATELRVLWFLIGDSFLVLFFSLLPIPLALAAWSRDALWGFCSALLGSWFLVGNFLAIRGDRRDHASKERVVVPVITPVFHVSIVIAFAMSVALWLSVFNFAVPRGQAIYVLGLIILLIFAAVEFLFFIGLMSQQGHRR